MKLEEVQLKLLSQIQSLPSEVALELVQQALREISRGYNWSWKYKEDILRVPALISTGTVSVTQFSPTVVPSASLKAILDAFTINDVPLIGRQLRVFGGSLVGPNFFYTITNYDAAGAGAITIDPIFQDATNAAATFQIFKSLYTAPELIERDANGNIVFQGIDFESFEYVSNPFMQRNLNLDMSLSDLEARGYKRYSFGEPYWLTSTGQVDSSGNRLFQLYQIPTSARTYKVLYKRSFRSLQPEESIPATLDYEVILAKAKLLAYEWLAVNADKVNDRRSPNVFMNMIALMSNPNNESSYPWLLQQAKGRDEEIFPQNLIDIGESFPYFPEVVVETVLLDF